MVEEERVLRPPGQLDLLAGPEQPSPAGVLLEHLELLAPRHPHEVLRAHADEADVGHDPAGHGVAGCVQCLARLADEHLLGSDPDPAHVAVGVRPVGRDGHVGAVHVDGHEVGGAALDRALDQVRLPEEVGHEGALGVLVEVRGRTHLLDHAGVHHRDRVGHGHGLLLVVGDVDERQPDVDLDPLELDLHRPAELEVEGAERLVEEQHLGLVDQRPGERDPLLLATRQLDRLLARLAVQLDQLQHVADLGVDVGRLAALEAERDVLVDVEVREERIALEHRVDRAPVRLGVGDVLAGQGDRAGRRRLETGDHPQRGGLAAPGRAEQREERTAGYVEVEVVDGRELAERLGDVAQPQPVVRLVRDGLFRPLSHL